MTAADRPASRVAARDRWLALGALLLLLALAYAVLVHPWWTVPMLEAGERIESLQQRELRLRMQLQQAPQVSRRLEAVRAQMDGRPGFLPESNPELATASLIQRLETVVGQASPGNRSCMITNRSPLAADSREPHTRVVVQVRLRCGTPELAAVLHSLESGAPRLFVGNLNILAQRMYFSPGRGEPTGSGGLDVAFDLSGYLAPKEAPRAD
ncbi:type II secretion system protein GspM [Novilysobacter arseniciresistens]|uniref:type II secretion system protein GspM n=1 Tax=Novilysobacter arseniciresistens TaxID=1385522 RepID=UPI00055E2352|nr:type II secretion system protein GspM [Lysobacter arseniciresistens]